MTDIQIYAGTLTANADDRSATGLLVPFGEKCSSNLGSFEVDPGVFTIPDDLTGVGLNVEHEREQVVGAPTKLTDTAAGTVATFSFAKTPEGDRALADALSGKRKNLSVEVADVVIRAGKAVSGRIFGAALVKAGAFPSATLLAAAADTPGVPDAPAAPAAGEPPVETTTTSTDEFVDEAGVTHKRTTTRVVKVETDDTGNTTTTVTETQVIEEPDPTQNTDPNKENPVTTTAPASVPATLAAKSAPAKAALSANDVFAMMTAVMTGQPLGDKDNATLLAALTDIKTSGVGQLPVGGSAIQPAWLGEVWQKKPYNRRYIPLIQHGDIVAFEEKGFSIATGDEPVKAWNGNKAELPTTSGTTAPITGVFQRWAVANDIAREFYDIPAGRAVIDAFVRLLINSYSKVTDYWTLEQLVAGATAQVDADTFPDGYSAALGKVIQAIDLVDDTDADPSFVVVAADVWKDLRYTPFEQIPQYITFGVGRSEGEADGTVHLVRDKASKLAAGQVLAGGYDVAHLNELPGESPVQLDALDIAHGGIDKAFMGYTQYMTDYAAGLVLVGDAAEEE
jgi:hypothetical protein